MKKLIVALGMACFCLAGCMPMAANSQLNTYARSTQMGANRMVGFSEIENKIENKETFMFGITQSTCSACDDFLTKVLAPYIKEHELEFNQVVLDQQVDSQETDKIYEFVLQHPNPEKYIKGTKNKSSDVLTPTFYFVKDGEVKEIVVGAITLQELEYYVVKYRLDAIK